MAIVLISTSASREQKSRATSDVGVSVCQWVEAVFGASGEYCITWLTGRCVRRDDHVTSVAAAVLARSVIVPTVHRAIFIVGARVRRIPMKYLQDIRLR